MSILYRENNQNWKKLDKTSYKNEAQLQNELYNNPGLLPVIDIDSNRKPIDVFIKEFGLPGSGNSDIIGVDRDGRIYLIETKLATNSEAKREVIGQMFEYAAFLWQLGFETFDQKILKITGKNLVALIETKIKNKDWSAEEFLGKVTDNLEKGIFSLIIAVDQINDSLKRIVDYMNLSSSFHFDIFILEMAYFTGEKMEVVTPKIYGIRPKESLRQSYGSKQWSEKEYFEVLKDRAGSEIEKLFKNFYQKFKQNKKIKIWFSGGEKEGYLKFGALKNNKKWGFFLLQILQQLTYGLKLNPLQILRTY